MSNDLPKLEILNMKDGSEAFRIKKRSTWNLPMRLLICGKSELSGKGVLLGNLMLRPFDETDKSGRDFYKDNFEGDNIYIICPSTLVDKKWQSIIAGKQIPDENIHVNYDEKVLEDLYDRLEAAHQERKDNNEPLVHSCVILDDVSASGDLKAKMNGIMSKFFCNGRHHLISSVVTSQRYADIPTVARENATGMCLFYCTQKQSELIYNDIGETNKSDFLKMFRKATEKKHSFMVVNYTNDHDERFLDSNFQKLV